MRWTGHSRAAEITALSSLAPNTHPPPHTPHHTHPRPLYGVCLFGVVLIASACVFGLCLLGGVCVWCRADGVPSAPCGRAVPSSLLSHREHRADRLLQGKHHFLSPPLTLLHREAATALNVTFLLNSTSFV